MPRTFGRNQLHVSQVNRVGRGRPTARRGAPDATLTEMDVRIAEYVVERIPNGATIQAGIGSIPNALLGRLQDHCDLGVHTELLSDALANLIDRGVVTGVWKRLNPGKAVTTFAPRHPAAL